MSKRKRDPSITDDGWLLLSRAVYEGDYSQIQALLTSGVNVNIKNFRGTTPLHLACQKKNLEIIQLLLHNGADLTAQDRDGDTPLYSCLAIWDEKVEVIQFLLENDGGSNIIHVKNKYGNTPLRKACERGHLDTAKVLLTNGADPNSSDVNGDTILHWACENCLLFNAAKLWAVVKLLMGHGANPNVKNNKGKTPLHRACEISELIGRQKITRRTWECRLKLGKLLIEQGADVNAKDNDGKTPLHLTRGVWALGWELAKLLLGKGADPNLKDKNGNTPLHLGCTNRMAWVDRDWAIPKLLIENENADLNVINNLGETPLHLACTKGRLDVVQRLLSRGANVSIETSKGDTPLHVACKERHPNVVWLLLRQYPWLVSERLE